MNTATLRLFSAIQVNNKNREKIPQDVMERIIRNGYILDPAIRPDMRILAAIEKVVGLSGEKANSGFHKSWAVVKNTPMANLVVQQIIHYMTTYGFESVGMYREDTVYIPREYLDLPAIKADIPLTVIKAMDAEEILESIIRLGSGIALAQETLEDIMAVVRANGYDLSFISQIENRELKTKLNEFYGIVPSEPVEFLRYLISNLTNETLIIKNDRLIAKIKQSNGKFLDVLLRDAPDDLASIFFRYKPLFLAMKAISSNKTFFNRLRKDAETMHKPVPEDYLNSVTAKIKHGFLYLDTLDKRLDKAGIFRKIRLAYALKHRTNAGDFTVYKVRNGKGWATDFEWPSKLKGLTNQALDKVISSIVEDVRPNVEGETIYIPDNVHYALPATEKQFTGHLPTGTSISVPKDLIVGIHWTNTNKRVDLDLSVVGESGKIGWDAGYRSPGKRVLFSGDMTDAPPPHGASELFYINKGKHEPRILFVNYYNFQKGDEVETRILVAHDKPRNFGKRYMVDVNKIIASANINISQRQNVLGLIATVRGENRVYFANVGVGSSITSSRGGLSTMVRKYLVDSLLNSIELRHVLQAAGAHVVDVPPQSDYVDLSPQALDKTTIIDLITPRVEKEKKVA